VSTLLLPVDLLPPSSNFSNGIFFVSLRVSSYGIYPLLQPTSSLLKGKIAAQMDENCMENEKLEKPKQPGANHDHHDPWWCPWLGRGGLWPVGPIGFRMLYFELLFHP